LASAYPNNRSIVADIASIVNLLAYTGASTTRFGLTPGHAQARGPMVMDAHLAALALEHGASITTTDRDFTRFPGIDLMDPTEATSHQA